MIKYLTLELSFQIYKFMKCTVLRRHIAVVDQDKMACIGNFPAALIQPMKNQGGRGVRCQQSARSLSKVC